MVKLSIIVPVYNSSQFLGVCLDSILGQKFRDFEIICVDDNSSDDSLAIVKCYAEKDNRIKILKNDTNLGASVSRNKALDVAKGEWILFVDSDDAIGYLGKSDGMELLNMFALFNAKADLVVFDVSLIHENISYMNYDDDKKYFRLPFYGLRDSVDKEVDDINVCPWGKFYSRAIIEKYGLRFPENLRFEDEYWYSCYSSVCRYVQCIEYCAYTYYRRNSGVMASVIGKKSIKNSDEKLEILKNIMSFYFEHSLLEGYLRKRLIKKVNFLFRSACKGVETEDLMYCYWKLGQILRTFNFDCSVDKRLELIKKGHFTLGDSRYPREKGKKTFVGFIKKILGN